MTPDVIRMLVREVLAEELGRLRRGSGDAAPKPRPRVREEVVSIRSSGDLMRFVERLLEVTRDGKARQEIEEGRWVFRLDGAGAAPAARGPTAEPSGHKVTIEQGLIGERQIDALPKEARRLVLGRRARLTPLARDRVRQRGIEIERIE